MADRAEQSSREQREVLLLVLEEGTRRLSLAELEDRLDNVADVDDAVERLIADGLLLREGDAVAPTPASAHFHRLRQAQAG